MDYRKTVIDKRIYNVIKHDKFINGSIYDNNTVIEQGDMVYLYDTINKDKPHIESYGTILNFDKGNQSTYNIDDYDAGRVIDFKNIADTKTRINSIKALKKIEDELMINKDNSFMPTIRHNDSPEMAGLKKAIHSKDLDIEKYKSRFGDNYGNDKRLLETSKSITFPKLHSMMEVFDIKGTLILEDANDNIPNPMGRQIIIPLN